MSIDPNKCSLLDCENELGPDAVEITHQGKPAGGICDRCVGDSKKLRVLLMQNKDGILVPEEISRLG